MSTPVTVERLLVEEGFLDGLDLEFQPGLNVIIGPRGVGKTSVVQLLRYCLGAPAFSDRFQAAADGHARSVLGDDGRVSASVRINGERYAVSRRTRDDKPEGETSTMPTPIVLAQTEIEEIGVDDRGRLRLIDGFRRDTRRKSDLERSVLSDIRSLTIELADLDRDITTRREETAALDAQRELLAEAELRASASQRSPPTSTEEMRRLDQLSRQVAEGQVRLDVLGRTADALTGWISELRAVRRSAPAVERWPGDDDPLVDLRGSLQQIKDDLTDADALLSSELATLESRAGEHTAQVQKLEDEARTLRRFVEEMEEGAGAAARQVSLVRERVAQLESLTALVKEQEQRRAQVREARESALESLAALREERHDERQRVAEWLNQALAPEIRVDVIRSGFWTEYAAAITDALKGSGLHYTDLAPRLAEGLSPRELAGAVERDDAQAIVDCGRLPEDRARRVVDRLREVGLADIIAAEIEDGVDVKLLDGDTFKPTEDLSLGQRCTAVLPIVLRHEEGPVVIDQPEDHLDGAFVVDTLVKAIRARGRDSQLIVSTHNPNIPVLGDAIQVTRLASDGHRGFERDSGSLTDPRIVEAITSVMEGGREAFARRAAFYGDV